MFWEKIRKETDSLRFSYILLLNFWSVINDIYVLITKTGVNVKNRERSIQNYVFIRNTL